MVKEKSGSAHGVSQQGSISSSGLSDVVNRPHENYRDIQWVPAWMLPTSIQIILSVLGALGGIFLGAGLQNGTQIVDVSDKVITEVAKICAGLPSECQGLKLVSKNSPPNLYLWIGGALLLIWIVGTVYLAIPSKKKTQIQ